MTVRESASALREQRTLVGIAEYDEFLDDAFCPFCRSLVTPAIGTPTIPAEMVDDDLEVDRVPVYGWRCDCRRAEIALAAPAEVAPDGYGSVVLDGMEIAVPKPALEAARPTEVDDGC